MSCHETYLWGYKMLTAFIVIAATTAAIWGVRFHLKRAAHKANIQRRTATEERHARIWKEVVGIDG